MDYPADWEIKKLGEIFDVFAGGDVKKNNFSHVKTSKYQYEVFSNGVNNKGLYGYTSKALYPANSLTVSARGTIGQAFFRDKDFDAVIRLLVLIPQNNNIQPKFYEYYINSQIIFEKENTGVAQLTAPKITNYSIPLPPLPEQKAIAETLENFDAHIKNLSELIEKKKAIRDGALDDLMTGRKRLKGFSGEWEVKKLGECGKFVSGNGFPLAYQGKTKGLYPFYKVSDLNNDGNEKYMFTSNNYISQEIAQKLSCNIIPANSIIFAKIGAAIFLERKRITTCNCCIDNNMMSFQPFQSISSHFICCVMQNLKFSDYVQTTALPSLSGKILDDILIPLPPLAEQKAIAETLTAFDDEIKALEAERDKIKKIRDGAMNDLLTGKIRLKF